MVIPIRERGFVARKPMWQWNCDEEEGKKEKEGRKTGKLNY